MARNAAIASARLIRAGESGTWTTGGSILTGPSHDPATSQAAATPPGFQPVVALSVLALESPRERAAGIDRAVAFLPPLAALLTFVAGLVKWAVPGTAGAVSTVEV